MDDVPGEGLGFIDVFSTRGAVLSRFAAGGVLNAPWGITPIIGGHFAGDILVGNFGDGAINLFSPRGQSLGTAQGTDGEPLNVPGLWDLTYGAGKDKNALFFTAGPNGETDGIFGTLAIQPLPKATHSTPATPIPKPTPMPTPVFGGYVSRTVAPTMTEMMGMQMLNAT